MISSTMNQSYFRKNIGKKFKFFPIPTRNSANGPHESDKNQWLLRCEAPDQKGFEFLNLFGDYNPLVLDPVKIKNFDEPDVLILRGQVILDGSTARYEPFTPQPASRSTPITNLSLSLEGADENGSIEIAAMKVENFQFCVTNTGEQTVRDYRVTILAPQAFAQPHYGGYHGHLVQEDCTTIGGRQYAVYRKLMLEPIYQNDTIRVRSILFSIDPGDYTIFWRIRCDDGVFPSKAPYGEIKITATPPGVLIKRADKHLFDNK
jgi:hypothetical protein